SLKLLTFLIVSGSLLFTLSSCDEASTSPGGGEDNGEVSETQYAIAASSGENSYLLRTDNVASGSVSAQSEEAIQVLGSRSWLVFEVIAAYSFLYAKGEPGTVSSYVLNDQVQLTNREELGLAVSMQVRDKYKENLLVVYSSGSHIGPVATFY